MTYSFKLKDREGFTIPVTIEANENGIVINTPTIDTYTETPGSGSPIFIEAHEGKLKLHAWDDTQEDPVMYYEWTAKVSERR